MPNRAVLATVGAVVVICCAFGCNPGNRYVAPPPPEVTVRLPTKKTIKTYLEYSGVLKAVESVELRARVKGFLKERTFEEGGDVKADQLLLVIDETEFKAKVEQAEARLAEANAALKKAETSKSREVATAQLALDRAVLLLAQVEDKRQRILMQRNAASQQDVDRADANTKKSQAQVEADEASLEQTKTDYDVNILGAKAAVKSAQAQLDQAKIDLGYCRIKAPTSGRVSRSYVDPGNLVGDGQATLLATLLREDEIYAYISISESDLLRFREMRAKGERPDFRKEVVPLDLGLMNEEGFPHRGRVQYAEPGLDPSTGTIEARGIFPNPDGKLVPGAFVRVRVPFETKNDALLVPAEAIGSDAVGSFVFVVNKSNVVERRKVVVGSQVDDERVIERGLEPTDRVIVIGVQRARQGQTVNPMDAAANAVSSTSEIKSNDKSK